MTGFRVFVCATAVGSGLMGGVFFAFSSFVMPALQRLPAPQGVAAMQGINVAAVSAPLMTALFGTAAAAVAVPIVAWRTGSPATLLLVIAGVCYVVGVVGVTVAGNVPLNDQLAATAASATTAEAWARWVSVWGGFNLIRTVAGLTTAALCSAALSRL